MSIDLVIVETFGTAEKHCKAVQAYIDNGYDLFSNHETFDGNRNEFVRTTYLTRGSRPGQAHKASVIEIQGLEIAALRAELVALQESFKHQSARIDVILREMQGDPTDEAVPLSHYKDVVQVIAKNGMNAYVETVNEAVAEDEMRSAVEKLQSMGFDVELIEVNEL